MSLTQLGKLLVTVGDLPGARALFERSLGIRESQAKQNPGSAQAQRDLSLNLNQLGDLLVTVGDLPGARALFERSPGIRESQAKQNPGSAQAQRDLSVSLERLGDLLMTVGDLPGARALFDRSLGIDESQAELNPGSAQARRDLLISYLRVFQLSADTSYLSKAFAIAEELENSGRLQPGDHWLLEALSAMLTKVAEEAKSELDLSREPGSRRRGGPAAGFGTSAVGAPCSRSRGRIGLAARPRGGVAGC